METPKKAVAPREGYETLTPLREVMNRLLEESLVGWGRIEPWFTGRAFPMDVLESETGYIVEAALPGFKPEEIEVTALEGVVTIHARHHVEVDEKKDAKKGEHGPTYLRRERATGEFTRIVELPLSIDPAKIEATYEHGLLTLRIPKTEQAKPTVIPIRKRERVAALN